MKVTINSIIVIGTKPPCPRCQLLDNIIAAKVKEIGLSASLKHLCYTSDEAKAIAEKFGLKPGTAKNVSEIIHIPININAFSDLAKNYKPDINSDYYPYNNCKWSAGMDEILRPYEATAREAGIMMTPVLVINGVIKHQGSVPPLSKIEQWLSELKSKA